MRHSFDFEVLRGVAICLALLMALTTVLHGHVNAVAAPHGIQWAAQHNHDSAAIRHDGRHAPCNDVGHTYHQGMCSASALGCSLCVPVDAQAFVATSHAQPVATAPPFASSPADVPIRLRPPKLTVIA
ncbi:MAG: hypothetical protein E5X80_06375 [Mesorhizobium sp.]|uniref:hypothetical protein n=1 Tax=Mesorhizobium sp. TaxID=1871066 RepID=UPI000FE468D2|nr:hypothetical protein [Mesorhizobium sp.]RWM08974.1 MAG: hypothetical protein EOR71_10695 [Mesorhizobium sp.]TIO52655.1 MAG: hypothetical protein E5X78_11580 [Mesorhizobium sp.]TIO61698.1 MAG: hypothetical protein E5X79_06470 [Mesorhizobium sp.]TJV66400.1 MAG: hypothetical protein E5X80_06375 [Mesorhizobium sp.]